MLAFLNLGAPEIAFLLVIFLLFFGADKVPELARTLGRARAEFSKAQRDVKRAMQSAEEVAWEEQQRFERAREHQMREQAATGVTPEQAAAAADAAGTSDGIAEAAPGLREED